MYTEPDFYVLRISGSQWVIPKPNLAFVGGSIGTINQQQLVFQVKVSAKNAQVANLAFVPVMREHVAENGKTLYTAPLEFISYHNGQRIIRRVYRPALARNAGVLITELMRNLIRNKNTHRVPAWNEIKTENLYRL